MPRAVIEEIDERYVLVIWVPAGINRPYDVRESVVSKHSQCKWYIRSGTSSIEAKGEVLDELREMANCVPFDDRGNPDITIDDISPILVLEHLKKVGSKLVKDFKNVSLAKLSELLSVSYATAKRDIAKLVETNKLRRLGPKKGGFWEIVLEE